MLSELVLVLVYELVLVLVLSGPEHAPEDLLIQPGLTALRHIAQQGGQRASRPPSAPENPERQKIKKILMEKEFLNFIPFLFYFFFTSFLSTLFINLFFIFSKYKIMNITSHQCHSQPNDSLS